MYDEHSRGHANPRERARGTLRRLVPLVLPHWRPLLAAVVASLGVLGAQLALPLIVKGVVDQVLRAGRRDLLVPYVAAALVLGAVETALAFARRNASGWVSLSVEFDMRNRLYAHLQRLQVAFHDGWQSGQLVSRAIADIATIRRFLGFGMLWLGITGATFLGVLVMLFRLDALLATATAICFVPVAFFWYRFSRIYHEVSRAQQDQQGDLTTTVEESATGVRIIKAFGQMSQRSRQYRDEAQTLMGTNMRAVRARSRYWSLDTLLLNLNLAVILLGGGLRVVGGSLTVGGLVAFVSYQLMLVWPMRAFGWIIATSQEAITAAERVFEVLDMQPAIDDRAGAREQWTTSGSIRFEGVEFSYPGSAQTILRGLDLEVRPAETLAIVGMTGSGKTTIAALVARFYDPSGGRVTLDGTDLRDLTLRSLRSHIGVAFEDPILFSASIRENLLMGKPGATDDELWEALGTVQADGFVRDLPWQLDTRVGEQGYSLSGGQRQRLALARAILGRPSILVLDDPLSSVDVHTEAAIEGALRAVLAGRTGILIAHRASTVLLADRVALVHDGRLVATGTHTELLETVPLYREVLAKEAGVTEEMETHA